MAVAEGGHTLDFDCTSTSGRSLYYYYYMCADAQADVTRAAMNAKYTSAGRSNAGLGMRAMPSV